jgi:ubiquinone/menaquinone biosynthesis C-methylase UbiE
MTDAQIYYDKNHIEFLQKLWGDGYLSPGGPDEVTRILRNIKLENAIVLDIGCGSGGITVSLFNDYGAQKVIGIDVETDVCDAALERVKTLGLQSYIDIFKVKPGSFPFEDASFDVVFSKDSIVHIEQKEDLSKEIFRVLKEGGYFLGSDWLRSHDGEPSPEMLHYLKLEDLGFEMASPARYKRALEQAGFQNIKLLNRNRWYTKQAKQEVLKLSKLMRQEFEDISSKQYMDLTIETWYAMISVLETGEHCPHHIKCKKPDIG